MLKSVMVSATAKSLQSCPTLWDPIDSSPPGSPIPGILQARTLEWVAISFSNAWKQKVKMKSLSRVRLLATPWTAAYQAPHPWNFPGKSTGVGCHCLLRLWSLAHVKSLCCVWPCAEPLLKPKKKKKTGFGKLEWKSPLHVPAKRTHKQVQMLNTLILCESGIQEYVHSTGIHPSGLKFQALFLALGI